jgi:hypothetical protein
MSTQMPASLRRLARSNPATAEPERVHQPRAQVVLQQILATPRSAQSRSVRQARRPRLIAIVVTAGLMTAGGALAAADPLGFWKSSTPGTAMYSIDTSSHAQTPNIPEIECAAAVAGTLPCGAGLSGQRYELADTARDTTLTRGGLAAYVDQAVTQGRISEQQKQQSMVDLAAVSDAFLTRFSDAMRFGTYVSGPTVPPPGVPMWIACQAQGATIACEDLNGDEHVPVGSAIYAAVPSSNWRSNPDSGRYLSPAASQVTNAIFGGPLTTAELSLVRDLAEEGITIGGGIPAHPGP